MQKQNSRVGMSCPPEILPEWGLRSEPMRRSFFLCVLEPAEAREYLVSYRQWFAERLSAHQAIKAHWNPQTEGEKAAFIVLEAGIMQAETAINWTDWAIEQHQD